MSQAKLSWGIAMPIILSSGKSYPLIDGDAQDILTAKLVETSRELPWSPDSTSSKPYSNELKLIQAAESHAQTMGLIASDGAAFICTALLILRDSEVFSAALKLIEISLVPEITEYVQPSYFISGACFLAPGLPKINEEALLASQALDFRLTHALLCEEQKHGINLEGGVPIFAGFIAPDSANPFVKAGHVFIEHGQVGRGAWHGIHSHRLQILALLEGFKQADFTFSNGSTLCASQLLSFLIDGKIWGDLLDSHADIMNNVEVEQCMPNGGAYQYLNPQKCQPIFSACGPAGLNSFLLCFGDSIGLPAIQTLLLKEHYYQLAQMVGRLQQKDITVGPSIAKKVIYDNISSSLYFSRYGVNDFGSGYPFLLDAFSPVMEVDLVESSDVRGVYYSRAQRAAFVETSAEKWLSIKAAEDQRTPSVSAVPATSMVKGQPSLSLLDITVIVDKNLAEIREVADLCKIH